MSKRLPYTPNSAIKAALRRLWLRSRERQSTLKRDNYSCCRCGDKQSKAKGKEVKVNVHHKHFVPNWDVIYQVIRESLLCSPEYMETLCDKCHDKEHQDE